MSWISADTSVADGADTCTAPCSDGSTKQISVGATVTLSTVCDDCPDVGTTGTFVGVCSPAGRAPSSALVFWNDWDEGIDIDGDNLGCGSVGSLDPDAKSW